MATSALKATFKFTDGDSRAVTFTPYAQNSAAVSAFKAKVKQFNATGVNAIATIFKGVDGGDCTGISDAEIITTEQTVVYARNASALARALADTGEDNSNG